MPAGREELVGRGREVGAARPGSGRDAELVVLSGVPGIGRSTVLGELARTVRAEGVTVLEPTMSRGNGPVAPVEAVRARFEAFPADPGLLEAVRVAHELVTGRSGDERRASAALDRLLVRVAALRPVVMLVDDVPATAPPVWLAAARDAGIGVVAAMSLPRRPDPDELAVDVDRVVDLPPLPAREVERLIENRLGGPVDRALLAAVDRSLGPLRGHPGALVATLDEARRERRLRSVHGCWCLVDPSTTLHLPPGRTVQGPCPDSTAGTAVIVLTHEGADVDLDTLADLGEALPQCDPDGGRAVDRLVEAGLVEVDAAGRCSSRCPAVAEALRRELGADALRDLHRAVTVAVARREPATTIDAAGLLVDLAAHAGTLRPAPPRLLEAVADRSVVTAPRRPHRAAARHHVAWRHTAPGPGRDRLLRTLLGLLVLDGRYDRLGAAVAEAVSGAGGAASAGTARTLAAAATLAFLHDETPMSSDVRAVVAAADPGALAFCDRWAAGEPVDVADLGPLLVALAPGPGDDAVLDAHRGPADVSPADPVLADRDLIPGLSRVLGRRYGRPVAGGAATAHALVEHFRAGRWDEALSVARTVLAGRRPDRRLAARAVVIAAEIHGGEGRESEATEWAADVPDDPAHALARAWLACGRRHRRGDVLRALSRGWDDYRLAPAAHDDPYGWALLFRLVEIAVTEEQHEWRARLGAEVGARTALDPGPGGIGALLAGLCAGDAAAASAALARFGSTGDRVATVHATAAIAVLDPHPEVGLRAADDLARALATAAPRRHVHRVMTRFGVPTPPLGLDELGLSALELEILDMVRAGWTNRQIARLIDRSEKTVEHRLAQLFAKFGCRTRQGLVAATSGFARYAGGWAGTRRATAGGTGPGVSSVRGAVDARPASDRSGEVPPRIEWTDDLWRSPV